MFGENWGGKGGKGRGGDGWGSQKSVVADKASRLYLLLGLELVQKPTVANAACDLGSQNLPNTVVVLGTRHVDIVLCFELRLSQTLADSDANGQMWS